MPVIEVDPEHSKIKDDQWLLWATSFVSFGCLGATSKTGILGSEKYSRQTTL